jgi:hypothetical protein
MASKLYQFQVDGDAGEHGLRRWRRKDAAPRPGWRARPLVAIPSVQCAGGPLDRCRHRRPSDSRSRSTRVGSRFSQQALRSYAASPRIAASSSLRPYGTLRTLASYEARTATGDPESARRFAHYWLLVQPFVRYIMRAALDTLRLGAERQKHADLHKGTTERPRVRRPGPPCR